MTVLSLPQGWTIARIGDIAIKGEQRKPNSDEAFTYVDIGSIDRDKKVIADPQQMSGADAPSRARKVINTGNVLVSLTRPNLNAVALVDERFDNQIASTGFEVIKPVQVDSRYVFALVRSKAFIDGISGVVQGALYPAAKSSDVQGFHFPLAPLAEQKVIADKLDTLLAQVENTKARLKHIPQLLKRFRQSVLAAGVTGKLSKDWRQENPEKTTEALLKDHVPLPRPPRWKSRSTSYIEGVNATAIGKPQNSPVKEWLWVPLVEIARMESGHTPSRSKPEYWGGDICWIGIKDANKNHATEISDTEQKTNELGLANSASRLLPKETVCISRTASVGYVVKMAKPMATSQDFVNWVPSHVVDPDWLMWLFVAERESLFKFGKGSTHTTVYFPEWLSMHVLLPHIEEQQYIARRVEQLLAYADTIETQVNDALARVQHLTQSILAKAFRGELTEKWRQENPNLISGDNSAQALLERIQAERIKKPKRNVRTRKPAA